MNAFHSYHTVKIRLLYHQSRARTNTPARNHQPRAYYLFLVQVTVCLLLV